MGRRNKLGLWFVGLALIGALSSAAAPPAMEKVKLSRDGRHFVLADSGKRFTPWGFNYCGPFGALAEEVWDTDWPRIEKDFALMGKLGVNVVRVHLQFGTYMKAPAEVDAAQIERLRKMLDLARDNGLYLDITGLGSYRLARVPAWYDALGEAERWDAQANFWAAIAKACAGHPAVFCYDLMNEPVVAGPPKPGEPKWVTGELGGLYFVQRLTQEAGKRSGEEIAEAWVAKMSAAIRKEDPKALVTVGVIPWALIWPTAKPIFYSPKAAKHLDFVCIHLYPNKGEIDKAITAMRVYQIGKPLVIEETFPLSCTMPEFKDFIDKSAAGENAADGWVSHFFGHTIEEHRNGAEPGGALVADFLEYWRERGEAVKAKREDGR
jgi:hypothetical protein